MSLLVVICFMQSGAPSGSREVSEGALAGCCGFRCLGINPIRFSLNFVVD